MARRRMFSLDVIDTDKFSEMSVSAQCLYFQLGMRADDDGFLGSYKTVMRALYLSTDDLQELIENQFIIQFESGVIVLRHWNQHNSVQKDRYKETVYQEERQMLTIINNVYELDTSCIHAVSGLDPSCVHDGSNLDTNGLQTGYQLDTQVRVGKDRLGKGSVGEERGGQASEAKPKKGKGSGGTPKINIPYLTIAINQEEYQILYSDYKRYGDLYPDKDIESYLLKVKEDIETGATDISKDDIDQYIIEQLKGA